MSFKLVYEVFSQEIEKPLQLVSVNAVGDVKHYYALVNEPLVPPKKFMDMLINSPAQARDMYFSINSMNRMRERVIVHRDSTQEQFQEKLDKLRSVSRLEVENARRNLT